MTKYVDIQIYLHKQPFPVNSRVEEFCQSQIGLLSTEPKYADIYNDKDFYAQTIAEAYEAILKEAKILDRSMYDCISYTYWVEDDGRECVDICFLKKEWLNGMTKDDLDSMVTITRLINKIPISFN